MKSGLAKEAEYHVSYDKYHVRRHGDSTCTKGSEYTRGFLYASTIARCCKVVHTFLICIDTVSDSITKTEQNSLPEGR